MLCVTPAPAAAPRTPCIATSDGRGCRSCCPRTPCIATFDGRGYRGRCPRTPCIATSDGRGCRCCCPRTPCIATYDGRGCRCCCPRTPCIATSAGRGCRCCCCHCFSLFRLGRLNQRNAFSTIQHFLCYKLTIDLIAQTRAYPSMMTDWLRLANLSSV